MGGTFTDGVGGRRGLCANCHHSIVEHDGDELACPTNCICPDPQHPIAACPAHRWRYWAQNVGASEEMVREESKDRLDA